MYLFCPNCQSQFPAGGPCPRCSSRLLSPVEVAENIKTVVYTPPRPIQPSFLGRLAVGAVLALGIHLTLREWALSLLQVLNYTPVLGFVDALVIRWVALLPGAVMAGSGRHAAASCGATVGGIVAFAWIVVDDYPNVTLDVLRGGMAAGMIAIGALLAYLGSRIWPPATELPEAELGKASSFLKLMSVNKPRSSRPTHWARILLTATLLIAAVLVADRIRTSMSRMPTGLFQVNGAAAAKANFEISMVLILVFGLVSGASTNAGFRHGFASASLATIGIMGLFTNNPEGTFTGLEWYLLEVDADSWGVRPPLVLGITIFTTVTFAGWLGGQLFPAISKRKRRIGD